jgi:hypothetical protein
MSDYFGALMQSSGLPVDTDATSRLDTARPVAPSPADYGIVEVDEQVNHAQNIDSAHMTAPLEPVQDHIESATGGEAARPSIGGAPAPSAIEKAIPVTVAPTHSAIEKTIPVMVPATVVPTSEAYATSFSESPVANGHTTDNEAPLRGNESSHLPSPDSPPVGPTLLQAALRWIASGESPAQAVPESAAIVSPQAGLSVVPKEVQARMRGEASGATRAFDERLELSSPSSSVSQLLRTQAVETPVPLPDSLLQQRSPAQDPGCEDAIEVTIGSINVRIDAPSPPAVAATAPLPAFRTSPESPPRSGLSRRTLWRI